MLTAFIVVSATLAYIIRRPKWQKAVILLSSIPVAIACNLLRLCLTAELFLVASSETAERFFHDFAGLTMMPVAVLILIGELMLLKKIAPDEIPNNPGKKGRVRVVRALKIKLMK
jgi:exosortase/archaeosortase family protein